MNESGYQVRPYRKGDENRILDLFNAVFSEGDPNFPGRSVEHWQWEYERCPAGQQVVVGEAEDGQIISHYACLPAIVNVQGQRAVAGQGVDSMVHKDWRRGLKKVGPFLATAQEYFRRWGNADVCHFGYGYPNRRAFRVGVRMLGYMPVFKPIPTLHRNLFQEPDDTTAGCLDPALEVVPVTRFDQRVDQLWQQHESHYPFALVRDATYLNWRYADCPLVSYSMFEVREGDRLRGWFVLQPNWQGQPILAIADYFAAPEDDTVLGHALRRAVETARETEHARVEMWQPESSPQFAAARRMGFGTEPSQYILCVMLYRDEPSLEWVRDHWYYAIGDSDVF